MNQLANITNNLSHCAKTWYQVILPEIVNILSHLILTKLLPENIIPVLQIRKMFSESMRLIQGEEMVDLGVQPTPNISELLVLLPSQPPTSQRVKKNRSL